MASIDFDIEDYLDEASTSDLLEELNKRRKRNGEKPLRGYYEPDLEIVMAELKIDNVADVLKFEHFIKKFRNIPESELDDFLNKYN